MIRPFERTLYKRIAASVEELHAELPVRQHNYAWKNNGSNILAVAHCDFVNVKGLSKRVGGYIKDGPIVLSPRLDDRLGVWLILDVLHNLGLHYDILLTTDEEIGRSTAGMFIEKEYNWVFQFDRRGTDAVTYDYKCMDDAVRKHFKLGIGSFSDICSLEQPGVNVGTGYYEEHTSTCYADLRDTQRQVKQFVNFYDEFKDVKFTHVPTPKTTKFLTYREREARWDRWEQERRLEDAVSTDWDRWDAEMERQRREEEWEMEAAWERWCRDEEFQAEFR